MKNIINMNEHDPELIKKFVEVYNQEVDWNRELRHELGLDGDHIHECIKEIINKHLDVDYITPETYDLANAQIHKTNTPGGYELLVYNYKYSGTIYCWTDFNKTKEEHRVDCIEGIRQELTDLCIELRSKLDEVTDELTGLMHLMVFMIKK